MDLDAKLPNNLWESLAKQSIAAIDSSQNTLSAAFDPSASSRGLCHNKKSERVQVPVVDDEIQTHSLDLHYTQIPIGKGQNK